MKLSTAIKKGSKGVIQIQGSIYKKLESKIGVCAIGAALIGAHGLDKIDSVSKATDNNSLYNLFQTTFPLIDFHDVYELNDAIQLNFQQIAKHFAAKGL